MPALAHGEYEGKRMNSERQSNGSIAIVDHQLNGRVTRFAKMRDPRDFSPPHSAIVQTVD